MFSLYAFGDTETVGFYTALTGIFIVSYILDITNIDVHFPFTDTLINSILKLGAIYIFFCLSSNIYMWIMFFIFNAYSFYINLALDSFDRRGTSKDRLIFFAVYSAIFFLGSSVIFGTLFYDQVSRRIGGGHPVKVEISVDQTKLKSLVEEYGLPFTGELIYANTDSIFIKINAKVIVIPRSYISWIRYEMKEEQELINSLKSLFIIFINNDNNKVRQDITINSTLKIKHK